MQGGGEAHGAGSADGELRKATGSDDCESGEKKEGDDFSDISDSELLSLQEAAESCDAYIEGEGLEMVDGVTSPGKIDATTSPEGQLHNSAGLSCSEMPGPPEVTQRKRKQESLNPLQKYHMRYLAVTDLCSQMWCEQQMVYKIEQPADLLPEKTAAMNEGSSIHLARELEVHDVVSVTTRNREDSWAIKCLNILAMIPVLQSGGRIREFPVFGELDGIFMVGVIDELAYSSSGELELRELKTRATPTLPRLAQKRTHELQVCVYKLLFDGMVSGVLQSECLIQILNLRPEQELGPEVKEHAIQSGLTVSTLKDIIELTFLNLTFSELPRIDSLKLEYCYQGDGAFLGCDIVNFKEKSVMEQVTFYLSFWKGQREIQGVDIEDTWKCRMCNYSNICEWRTQRTNTAPYRTMAKRLK
ncbi:PREDICTED: exonuclease V [Nanorana parkeri]|uniref:exonuclease V n=1 Tax=Nanorana parkeri TaxID=125878 RepID=UPI000854094C|nr:PREDICTED: exonuclease V [Nanorana parkeri]